MCLWLFKVSLDLGALRTTMESHRRSLLKALSWRLVALLITFVVALLLFEDVKVAASVGLLDSLVKIVVYYLHERAWLKVPLDRHSERRLARE